MNSSGHKTVCVFSLSPDGALLAPTETVLWLLRLRVRGAEFLSCCCNGMSPSTTTTRNHLRDGSVFVQPHPPRVQRKDTLHKKHIPNRQTDRQSLSRKPSS
ncbi:uncharacterized protein LOC119770847 [Culex quinquefasciatus]|uniref:uncharacterized protein LOC119770847 n=1 Tax=Culex quinquefasciatus TaxID=7176 RepID=UPI0018E2DA0A|nr:uncharacterized protein LOC119770847 [Culex quinquefasciatus]